MKIVCAKFMGIEEELAERSAGRTFENKFEHPLTLKIKPSIDHTVG